MALNQIVFTENVLRSFLRYQLMAYPFADEGLRGQMRELLSLDATRESPLLKGPYVSLSRPFRKGSSIDALMAEGLLHPHMRQRIPAEITHLYGHQEEAVRAIQGGRTTLVSTGTGSSKTECFLYPVISKCLDLRDEGAVAGVTAVIVYPMNALAEDQLMRLRGSLPGPASPPACTSARRPSTRVKLSAFVCRRGRRARSTRPSWPRRVRAASPRQYCRPRRSAHGRRCAPPEVSRASCSPTSSSSSCC